MDTAKKIGIATDTESHLGPGSISIIEEKLCLGGRKAAKNVDVLKKYNITHILTIDKRPLHQRVLEQKHILTKFIQLSDQPNEDILSHFVETDLFITGGIEKGIVLVHCYSGKSRSAAVVIAYLMKKYHLTYFEAFDRVKTKRKIIFPNPGFVSQLKLYGDMGYQIDNRNMHYKIHRLTVAAHRISKENSLPQEFYNLIHPDPNLEQAELELNIYRCKKCRRILATQSNLLLHQTNSISCKKKYFVEPMTWMNVTQKNEGKLLCPKCSSKLGSYSWIEGCMCPCGVQVTPAFYLTPSKVDFSNVIKQTNMDKRRRHR